MPAPVVIIGGGIVGSCAAFFLAPHADVIVLERDPTYQFASTTLSVAAYRQQFSLPVNLHMSRYGAEFLEERAERVGLVRRAYLILATEAGEEQLKANRRMQLEQGAKVALFDGAAAIAERFPWLRSQRTLPAPRSASPTKAGSMPTACCAPCERRRSPAAPVMWPMKR